MLINKDRNAGLLHSIFFGYFIHMLFLYTKTIQMYFVWLIYSHVIWVLDIYKHIYGVHLSIFEFWIIMMMYFCRFHEIYMLIVSYS